MSDKTVNVLLLFWGSRGGGSIFTYYLAEHLRSEAGCDVQVSLRTSNDDLPLFMRAGLPVITLDFASVKQVLSRPWAVFSALSRHVRALKALRPDIAIITMNGPFAWPYVGALKASGCRIVYVAHDARPHPGDYARRWQSFTQGRLLNMADRVVALSQHVGSELLRERPRLNVSAAPLDIVYPERPSSRCLPLQSGKLRFLVLGRLIRYKGFDVLHDAVSRLGPQGWSLTIAGHGPLRAEIEERFSTMANIDLELAWLTDERMFDLMASHDVLICNYSEASQSGLIAQALSCGMPVVATDRGALPEQLGHVAGLLTDGSASDLAEKMQTLMASPEQLADLAEASRNLFVRNKKQGVWAKIIRSVVANRTVDEVTSGP